MLWLSDEAIKYAISMCRKRQGYKVGLALSQSRVNRNYVKECIRVGLGTTDDFRAINIGDVLTINFHNGSRIETMSSRNNVRGKRFHLLIADENISDEFYSELRGHYEILGDIERQEWRTRRYPNTLTREDLLSTHNWECEFFQEDNNREIADVSESEFMEILNISIPQ